MNDYDDRIPSTPTAVHQRAFRIWESLGNGSGFARNVENDPGHVLRERANVVPGVQANREWAAANGQADLVEVLDRLLGLIFGSRAPRTMGERGRVLEFELARNAELPVKRSFLARPEVQLKAYVKAGLAAPGFEFPPEPPPAPPKKEPEPAPLMTSVERSYAALEDIARLRKVGLPVGEPALRAIAEMHDVPSAFLGLDIDDGAGR